MINTGRNVGSAPAPRRRELGVLTLGSALMLAGCSDMLTVENPQEILDQDLNSELAIDAVINGVAGDFAYAYSYVAYMTGHLADELIHTGSDTGIRAPSNGDTRTVPTWSGRAYDRAVAAAFTADDAIRRFTELLGDSARSHRAVAEAHIYGGFVYMMLAENMCQVTFDGGPPVDPADVYPLAEEHFATALAIADAAQDPTLRLRAMAGRARARISMGDYEGARADARQIPDGFVFLALYSDATDRENNILASRGRTGLRKESGVRPTFYEDPRYHADPRTPFIDRGPDYFGADGVTRFVEQDKYPSEGSDMEIFSWQEARLVEAEAELMLDRVGRAVELINKVRAAAGLQPYAGALSRDAVFDQLIYERSAEYWLEAQRLRDLRRTDDPFLEGRDTCFPPSITEQGANPNL